jgi:hypothetical protein
LDCGAVSREEVVALIIETSNGVETQHDTQIEGNAERINSEYINPNITFKDPNFKAALIRQGVDKNGDGEISEEEALLITKLHLSH